MNTMGNENKNIRRIFKLEKESDNNKFTYGIENRVLLFHGSRVSNFLSIMSQGLRIQPAQAKRQGALLGRGVYFTDMFQKAFQYTQDNNGYSSGSRFVLICEVALGE